DECPAEVRGIFISNETQCEQFHLIQELKQKCLAMLSPEERENELKKGGGSGIIGKMEFKMLSELMEKEEKEGGGEIPDSVIGFSDKNEKKTDSNATAVVAMDDVPRRDSMKLHARVEDANDWVTESESDH